MVADNFMALAGNVIFKNIASQKLAVYAWDHNVEAPKTGDAANITMCISKDFGAVAASDDTNPTELDSTDMKGIYYFNLTQDETNCEVFTACIESSTAHVVLSPYQIRTEVMLDGIAKNYNVIASGFKYYDSSGISLDADSLLANIKGYNESCITVENATTVLDFPFRMTKSVNGKDALTGEAGSISAKHSKDGGALSALAGSVSEIGEGLYSVDLTNTETNCDMLVLSFTHADGLDAQVFIKTQGAI